MSHQRRIGHARTHHRAEVAEYQRARADGGGLPPIDAALALKQNRAEDSRENEREQRRGAGLMRREGREGDQRGNQQNAADADRADQKTNDGRGDEQLKIGQRGHRYFGAKPIAPPRR